MVRGRIGARIAYRKMSVRSSEGRHAVAVARALSTSANIDLAAGLHYQHRALLRALLPHLAALPPRSRRAAIDRLVAFGPEPLRHFADSPVS